jgi:hypothetical protein
VNTFDITLWQKIPMIAYTSELFLMTGDNKAKLKNTEMGAVTEARPGFELVTQV